MEPRPHYEPQQVERKESLEEKIEIPTEIAWPFQMRIFVANFLDKKGKRITDLDDELIEWWAEKYGNSFREYCDLHPNVAKQILLGDVNDEDILDMVSYIKSYPTSDEDIKKAYDSLQKYIVH